MVIGQHSLQQSHAVEQSDDRFSFPVCAFQVQIMLRTVKILLSGGVEVRGKVGMLWRRNSMSSYCMM